MLKIAGIQTIQSKISVIHSAGESTVTQIQDIQGRVNSTLYTVFFINWTLNALLLCSTLLYTAMPSLAPCFEYSQPYSYVIFSNIGQQCKGRKQCWEQTPLPPSHQSDPGSNPGIDAICNKWWNNDSLSLLLILSFALTGFSLFSSKANISKFRLDQWIATFKTFVN